MSLKLTFKVQCVTLIFPSLNCQKPLLCKLYSLVIVVQSSICIPHEHKSVLQSIEMWSLWENAECGVRISTSSFNMETKRIETQHIGSLGSSEVTLFSIPFYTYY